MGAGDRLVECASCSATFTLEAREIEWFYERKFELPKRCPPCRKARRLQRESSPTLEWNEYETRHEQ
jgi:hypothetical protein